MRFGTGRSSSVPSWQQAGCCSGVDGPAAGPAGRADDALCHASLAQAVSAPTFVSYTSPRPIRASIDVHVTTSADRAPTHRDLDAWS
jgi:hypothetical protein